MVEAKLLRKKLKNGLIVDKWDLVTIIEKQQAEIEALKKEAALQRLSDFTQEADNEPVAWMSNGKEFYVQKNYCPDFIPLYTHPVKELTDEEIIQINKDEGTCWDVPDRFAIQIAKAILRKAQEK